MVQTFQISGLAAIANAGLSLGAFIGLERVAVLTAVRHIMRRSYALAAHSHGFAGNALAAHSHGFAGNALAVHSHNAFAAACIGASNNAAAHTLMWSAGLIVTSIAHGAVPWTNGITGGTPAGAIGGVSGGTPAGAINGVTGGTNLGITSTARVVDSFGRYVAEATHPAAGHVALKPHGAAGPRLELGDAVRAGDILQITVLMLAQSGGIF